MKNYKQISAEENFLENLAEAFQDANTKNHTLICKPHKVTGEMTFSLNDNDYISKRGLMGATECVSTISLISIFGENFQTSEDGMAEALKVKEWMDKQN